MKLGDTTVFISGGASGLGEATARHFVATGATVGLLDRDAERGQTTAADIGAVFAQCDVADDHSIDAAFEHLSATLGAPRAVVACAGIGSGKRMIGRSGPHDSATFRKVVEVNLIGTFNLFRLAAAAMAELEPLDPDGERGVLVGTASIAAFDGVDGGVAYSASKGGVAAMMLPLARDLAGRGIRAVAIAPGSFDTPMVAGMPPEFGQRLSGQTPFPARFGRPPEFAALAAHIVENSMLNGTTIRIDGGLRMMPSEGWKR